MLCYLLSAELAGGHTERVIALIQVTNDIVKWNFDRHN